MSDSEQAPKAVKSVSPSLQAPPQGESFSRRSFFGALIALPFIAKVAPKTPCLKITDSLGKHYYNFTTHNLYRSTTGVMWEAIEAANKFTASYLKLGTRESAVLRRLQETGRTIQGLPKRLVK